MKNLSTGNGQLFVYGSLAPGGAMAGMLEAIGGQWRPATVRGRLYPDGIGPVSGYPVLELDPSGTVVSGYLFSSDRLAEHWQEVDEYEGEGYRREMTKVTFPDGTQAEAHVYVLDRALSALF